MRVHKHLYFDVVADDYEDIDNYHFDDVTSREKSISSKENKFNEEDISYIEKEFNTILLEER